MKPSIAFENHRQLVRDLAARHNVANPRIFGSVLHGTDTDESDVDVLVDALPGTTWFDLGGLESLLEDALGVPVQVVLSSRLGRRYRDRVLAEAEPV